MRCVRICSTAESYRHVLRLQLLENNCTMPPYLSKKQKIGLVLALSLTMEPWSNRKKKKRLWSKQQHLDEEQLYQMSVMRELDNQDFRRCLRMDSDSFDMLLNLVRPLITKRDTIMRQAVSAEDRLLVTLKYLVLGKEYTDLAYSSGISIQLISKIVPETCDAICKILKNYLKLPETEDEWLKIAEQYQKKWQFNHCVGSVGARHILVIKPKQRAPQYCNYNGTFSVILFAIVNADFEFLYVHAGTEGCLPAGPILQRSFYKTFIEEELDLPQATVLPKSKSSAPYVFLGDTGFGLDKYILEPYPQENITQKMRVFNYRLWRATRVIENVFGILASRFRVFQQSIRVDIQNVDKIIMASCYLHNYLIKTSPHYITSACVDSEDNANGTFQEGLWRDHNALLKLQKCEEKETRDDSIVKNVFKEYFNGPGRVEFSIEC